MSLLRIFFSAERELNSSFDDAVDGEGEDHPDENRRVEDEADADEFARGGGIAQADVTISDSRHGNCDEVKCIQPRQVLRDTEIRGRRRNQHRKRTHQPRDQIVGTRQRRLVGDYGRGIVERTRKRRLQCVDESRRSDPCRVENSDVRMCCLQMWSDVLVEE